MNELLELLNLVDESKREEAQKLADAVSSKINSLDGEVTKQESMKLDAIKSRDEAKKKLKEIASELGIEDVENVADAIEGIRKKKGGKEDDSILQKEIESLKTELARTVAEKSQVEESYKQKLLSVALEKDIATILPKYKAKASATTYIINAIKERAVYEDGKLVFKNEDGTTIRSEGRDATLDDIVKGMQAAEKKANESMFFDISIEKSGVSGNQGGKPIEGDFIP